MKPIGCKKRKKRPLQLAAVLTALVWAVSMWPVTVKADYRYDSFGNAIPSQYAYMVETSYNGLQLGIGAFNAPTDLFVAPDDRIYMVDAGNDRIVILTEELEVERILDSFTLDGQQVSVKGITGIFVHTDGKLYMADKDNGRILVADENGSIEKVITRPESNILTDGSTTNTFLPAKILVDSRDTIYMISENSTQGAYMLSMDGEFLGYYGRNKVLLTWERLYEATLRRFASDEQREIMENFIPIAFSNFDIDRDGFIYTVTGYSEHPEQDEMIKKLNPLGNNIYTDGWMTFGDMPNKNGTFNTVFTDVAVDDYGFVFALDSYSGRIFFYDNMGCQQAIFGGRGNYLGTFTSPAAIDIVKGRVLVLDSAKNNITVFAPTYFGSLVREAFLLFNDGFYLESKTLFEEIVRMDSNYDWAYAGLGRACYEEGDWEMAKYYFERSDVATSWYSEVKEDMRNQKMKENFTAIFFGFIALFIMIAVIGKLCSAALAERHRHAATEDAR